MKGFFCLVALLSIMSSAFPQQKGTTPGTASGTGEVKGGTSNVPPSHVDCGCELPLPEIVAVVNGIKITKRDFNPELQKQISQLQEQVAAARQRELELQINSLLLEAEAKRLKLSSYQLLENEVVGKVVEPTEADAQAFYNENKTRINREFSAVKNEIVAHLREQRQRAEAAKLAERLRAANTVQVLIKDVTPPATDADRSRLFATVNVQRITSADIEESLLPLVFKAQEQMYELLKTDLDLKINDILLSNEALKRQVTTRELLETEVDKKVPMITEAQARTFYDDNKERIEGDFIKIKDQIAEYLREREAQRLRLAFATRLRQAVPLQIHLNPPVTPVLKIATDNQPSKGNPLAPVTIVEFTDFQCSSCATLQPILDRLLTEYGNKVRLVVRDYPLNQHEQALKAAEAAEAARAQGKYWEYVSLLYANQAALETDQLKNYASRIGLDRARFDAALDGGAFAETVLSDMRAGDRVGVAETPTFFVNGRRTNDRSYEGLRASVEAALKDTTSR